MCMSDQMLLLTYASFLRFQDLRQMKHNYVGVGKRISLVMIAIDDMKWNETLPYVICSFSLNAKQRCFQILSLLVRNS